MDRSASQKYSVAYQYIFFFFFLPPFFRSMPYAVLRYHVGVRLVEVAEYTSQLKFAGRIPFLQQTSAHFARISISTNFLVGSDRQLAKGAE
ncbi:hypothetical protein BDV35DRAFT_193884 [Aspergillus flavus]|uniref:Uncharacterized protein n=1 Tax=Aspergillus flavus TaxID=5059 RepID=A0A5N6H1W8_ASPFL|nr:hypothetical protein BDV35DRAFT_193884 [Aspergillus flavus]